MKEAAFKARYSLSKEFLDFRDLKLSPDGLVFERTVPHFERDIFLPILQWCGSGFLHFIMSNSLAEKVK